jgi:hypothetical protein
MKDIQYNFILIYHRLENVQSILFQIYYKMLKFFLNLFYVIKSNQMFKHQK